MWKKIIANVLGIAVEVPEVEEGPSMGGAMMAAVACGEYESVEACAEKIVRVKETVLPDEELTNKYNERYNVFKQIYPALKAVFPKLSI